MFLFFLNRRCLEYLLEDIEHERKSNIMVATHNKDTVEFTLEKFVLVSTSAPNVCVRRYA